MGRRKKISREVFKYFELNENENTAYHNLWKSAKTVLRKFIDWMHILVGKRPKNNHQVSFYLRKPEKEQIKSKASRRKEVIKIRAEINRENQQI